MHLNDRRFSQHLVIGPLSTSASHVDHIIRKSFWAIFISIETYWDALRPSSPLDFSEWLLMTKTYGYEGVFIDLENDRGSQEMILKWCPPKHLSLLTFPSLLSFRFRSLFANFFFWRQVQIDHQQLMCTVLTILQNICQLRLPDCQTDSVLTSVERSIFLFSFHQLWKFPSAFLSRFHFHSTNMQLIVSGLLLVGAAVAHSVNDTTRGGSTRASSSTDSYFQLVAPTLAPTYGYNNNNNNTSVISTVTVTSTEVRFF